MVEIIFRGGKIQTGFRIKIPKAIIDTLELEESQKIVLKFDAEKRIMIVEEEKSKNPKDRNS